MALSVKADCQIAEVGALIHRLQDLGAGDIRSIRSRVNQSIDSYGKRRVRDVLHNMLLELYDSDTQRMKDDITRQMMLKGTVELSRQEKQHCMRFIWQYLSEYLEKDDSFFKDLLKPQ